MKKIVLRRENRTDFERGDSRAKVMDTCRKYGISDATYCNWRSKYGGMSVNDVKRLKKVGSRESEAKTSGRRPGLMRIWLSII